jgi:hypothetical protein
MKNFIKDLIEYIKDFLFEAGVFLLITAGVVLAVAYYIWSVSGQQI